MFVFNEVQYDVEEVLGTCVAKEPQLVFSRVNSALDLLQPMLPTDSNIGVLDTCVTHNCEITLPYFVEAPLAVNVAGHPADFRNKWYEHHLNGPGSQCCGENCTFGWQNEGLYPTFRDLTRPSYLAAFSDAAETPIPSITIFGEDINGKPLYSCHGDNCQSPGLVLPITSGVFSLALLEGAPRVRRITQVVKPVTCNFVRLIAFDEGRQNGTLIGYYRPEEQAPAYRRLKLSGTCNDFNGCSAQFNSSQSNDFHHSTWARMRYQKRQMPITTINDVIFVPSREALINAVEAVKQQRANNFDQANKYLAFARAALEERQEMLEGPNTFIAQYPNEGTYGGGGLPNMV
jgi:hypothetical protein